MKSIFLPVSLAFVLLACKDDAPTFQLLPPGTYEGDYYRFSMTTPDPEVAHVHLSLKDGAFSGGSNIARYPAICNGKYWVSGLQVEFNNLCVWTADFDWTLILNGKFEISTDGDYFQLVQNKGEWINVYKIKRNSIN